MIEVWILQVCFGISWGGCGGVRYFEFPTETACYKSLDAMRLDTDDSKASEKRRSMWAVCYPDQRERDQ